VYDLYSNEYIKNIREEKHENIENEGGSKNESMNMYESDIALTHGVWGDIPVLAHLLSRVYNVVEAVASASSLLAFSLIQISYPLNVNRSEGFNRKLRSVLARLVVLVILL
jgi:hypothetical protein